MQHFTMKKCLILDVNVFSVDTQSQQAACQPLHCILHFTGWMYRTFSFMAQTGRERFISCRHLSSREAGEVALGGETGAKSDFLASYDVGCSRWICNDRTGVCMLPVCAIT